MSAYQIACLAVVGIVALSFAMIAIVAWGVISISSWVDAEIRRHHHDAR